MRRAKSSEKERQESIEVLKGWLKPGSEVLCVLRHRSASGMFRRISLLTIVEHKDGPYTVQMD